MAYLLIVEDSPYDRSIAEKAARAAGFSSFKSAATLSAALSQLQHNLASRQETPAAILFDLDMGLEAGLELLRASRQNRKLARIPIIFWTQFGEENRRHRDDHREVIVLSKWSGPAALGDALAELKPYPRSSGIPAYPHRDLPAMLEAQ